METIGLIGVFSPRAHVGVAHRRTDNSKVADTEMPTLVHLNSWKHPQSSLHKLPAAPWVRTSTLCLYNLVQKPCKSSQFRKLPEIYEFLFPESHEPHAFFPVNKVSIHRNLWFKIGQLQVLMEEMGTKGCYVSRRYFL